MNTPAFLSHALRPALSSILALLCLCTVAAFTFGCEDHDTIGGKIVDKVSGDDKSSSKNISGTWTGTSGSGHFRTVVNINDNGGAISGSLRWSWGGVRRFSGQRNGNSVHWVNQADSEGVVDTWDMTLSSDGKHLTGHANKSNGGGYSISLSR